VLESLIVLKALTHEPTGGTVAAPTTSLPEAVGGVRNWDYRYCWVRDASLSIFALMETGYVDEAIAFRDWLLRATAGDPRQIRILYGIAGERHLREEELEWLAGYEGARPVRIGNDAAEQFQLDIFGELVNAGHEGRVVAAQGGRSVDHERQQRVWRRNLALLSFLETVWTKPDQGIWEVRGPPRHFTYSKVMCWVAFDRAVKAVEEFGMDGPVDRWRRLREEIHSEVCEKAYDPERRTFTQYYGSHDLDASVLLIPSVGFLPASDERVQGTIDAIERELTEDGFVYRYSTARERGEVDGLPGEEGAFLPCSFWLAGALALSGRRNEGHARFERLLEVRNDVGLLSEEYDPRARRMVGNFPQAFTHLSLVNTARHFSEPPQQ
jgi:GH15 family glucan-1,4-alpha-glucosidase